MTSHLGLGNYENNSVSVRYRRNRGQTLRIAFLLMIICAVLISSLPLNASGTNIQAPSSEVAHSANSNVSFLPPVFLNKTIGPPSLYPNPYEIYQKEPAPMGIADYGIGPNSNHYVYSTTSFLGALNAENLSIVAKPGSQGSAYLSFQLNVNLEFTSAGSQYVYWIQNVMLVNSTSGHASFVDNIWNFSSQRANVYSSAVLGNGTIGSGGSTYFYYDSAGSNLPGNDINLSFPYEVKLLVNVSVSAKGFPVVAFLYNDGYGWIAYDMATFVVAKKLTSTPVFLVDGLQYEPTGYTFYDAEFVMGGGGSGSQAVISKSNIQLRLDYFNGHNYQMVENAYNFGSDTAEGVSNVTDRGEYYSGNGSLFSDLSSGSGSLGILYLQNQISIVNVSAPISSGVLSVNGTITQFSNGSVNVTLAPTASSGSKGYYTFGIYTHNGTLLWSRNISLTSGEYLAVDVNTYPITFSESSFPAGTLWYLNLSDGESFMTTNSSITLHLPNGNYSYAASPVKGGYHSVSGSFRVDGKGMVIDVQFQPIQFRTYSITFSETGLASGATWSITLNGTIKASIGTTVVFPQVTNGTYVYLVGNVSGYLVEVPFGHVIVSGSNVTVAIAFNELYPVTFSETGLPGGTTWYVNLSNGESSSSMSSNITFKELNGSYSFTIGLKDQNSFKPSPFSGSFVINGNSYHKSITFSKVTFSVSFEQSGLGTDRTWTVILNGTPGTSAGNITFNETNGTYPFTVSGISGYKASYYSGTVVVNGKNAVESISWSLITYQVTVAVTGISSGTPWSVFINGTSFDGQSVSKTVNSTGETAVVNLPNGSYRYSVKLPPGYNSKNAAGKANVDGSSLYYGVSASKATSFPTLEVVVTILVVGIGAGIGIFMVKGRKKALLVREDRFLDKDVKKEDESEEKPDDKKA